MNVMEWALKAARVGLHVFPTEDKLPVATPHGRLKWGSYATTDPRVIEDWWLRRCPGANGYGIAAKPSRLLIVDCDVVKGSLPGRFASMEGLSTGEDVLAAITESLGVEYPFDTLTIDSASGGAHLYFRNAGNVQLRNSPIVAGAIDIRANGGSDGGYCIGPGSVRSDGGEYRVRTNAPIRPAPPWLMALASPLAEKPRPPRAPGPTYAGEVKMDGVLRVLSEKTEPGRNHCLHWAACCYAKDGQSLDTAIRELEPVALDIGLDKSEIQPTIRSGFRQMGR